MLPLVCIVLIAGACTNGPAADGFGLKLVELTVDSEAAARMRHGVYTETPVPCSVAMDGVSLVCNIAVAGATTRDDLKKNFDLELRGDHHGRRSFRLSAISGDPSALRALLALHIFEAAGLSVSQAEPIAVWLNDRYLGLYLLVEPIDSSFFRRRGDAPRQLYKARDLLATLAADSDVAAAFSVRIGSDEFTDLKQLIHLLHLPPRSESRAALARLVNADNVARYMAAAALVNHWDGIINNYYLARTNGEPRFSVHPWDLDQTFEGIVTSESAFFRKNALMSHVFNDEAGYDSYREALGHLSQVTTAKSMAMLIDDQANRIREAYQQDPLLGGAGESLEDHAAWLKGRAVRQQQWFEP